MGTIFCATRFEIRSTTTKTLTSNSKWRKRLRRVSFPVSLWSRAEGMSFHHPLIFVGMSGLLQRLDEFCALAGEHLQVFLSLVSEFGELDAEAIALAIANDTD